MNLLLKLVNGFLKQRIMMFNIMKILGVLPKIYLMTMTITFVGMGITKLDFFLQSWVFHINLAMYSSGIILVLFIGFSLFGNQPKIDKWLMNIKN